jgi:uncharacterized Tic20 family protein
MDTPVSTPSLPSNDERVMAALGHISAFLPTIGIIAPIVIWVTQKDKSRYVYFQSLQAIVYHFVLILGWFLAIGCYMLSFLGTFVMIPFMSDSTSPYLMGGMLLPFLIIGLAFLGWFIYIVYAVVADVLTFQGKDFRYIIIGDLIKRSMQK